MTDTQTAAIYKQYTADLAAWRKLPAAQKKAAPPPQWEGSAAKLGLDSASLKAKAAAAKAAKAAEKKAAADLARAKAEEAAATAEAAPVVKQN